MGNLDKFTDCATHPPRSPYKEKHQGGNPFTKANQGYTFSILTVRKGTNNLRFLGFHFMMTTHLLIKRET